MNARTLSRRRRVHPGQLALDFRCRHEPGHVRRHPSRAGALIRCVVCGQVVQRLGIAELTACGVELGSLLCDRGSL
jgi:hypothetical protein